LERLDPAACSVLKFDRSTYHYKSRRREQAGLEARIKRSARRASGMAPCSSAPRGLGDQHEEDASGLYEFGPATAQQDAKEKSEGVQRSSHSFHIQLDLGHGLHP